MKKANENILISGSTLLPSSQQNTKNEVSVETSSSIRDTKTSVQDDGPLATSQDVILSTPMVSNSSYIDTERLERKTSRKSKRYLHDNNGLDSEHNHVDNVDLNQVDHTGDVRVRNSKPETSRDYYSGIKPTKTISAQEHRIVATQIRSGEENGVSMAASRPQRKNYEREYRGEENESKKKKYYKSDEKNLGSLAKVRIDDRRSFRESREEENRKANPDIQDIITGIVKILNGKTQDGRPRPSSTRINNRGPPRISDVPPLDFDGPATFEGPPTFVPLPPPPSNTRVPPPYPFDVPPPMQNVPLPPQPSKSGSSNLPTHPFIDGVPVPEKLVPGKPNMHEQTEYDTISMSEADNGKIPSIANNATKNVSNLSTVTNVELKPKNETKNEGVKQKTKLTNQNKRPRPRPQTRPRPNNGTRLTIKNETLAADKKPHKNVTVIPLDQEKDRNVANATASPEINSTTDKLTTIIRNVLSDILGTTESTKPKKNETNLPVLLDTSGVIGVGEATPVLESSIPEVTSATEVVSTAALNATRTSTTTVKPIVTTSSSTVTIPSSSDAGK